LAKSSELGPFALTLKTRAQEFKNEVVAYMASCLEPMSLAQLFYLVLENPKYIKNIIGSSLAQEVLHRDFKLSHRLLGLNRYYGRLKDLG